MSVLYKSGFLFTPDITNAKWTEHFLSHTKLEAVDRMVRGRCYHVAEYFYSNLNGRGELQSLYPYVSWIGNISSFSDRCLEISKELIPIWNTLHQDDSGILGHGESCMVSLPGYVYVSSVKETYNVIINELMRVSTFLRDWKEKETGIKELVRKVFLLRYGEEPETYNKPAEYYLPCIFLSITGHSPEHLTNFDSYMDINDKKINTVEEYLDAGRCFHFINGKQDNSGDLNEPVNTVSYFIIHDTAGASNKEYYYGLHPNNYSYNLCGKGHAYICNDGEIITIVPYTKKAWATKVENKENAMNDYQNAWGSCIHIELVYRDPSPNDAQYNSLARLYYYLFKANSNKKLTIVPHLEFDRGIPDGHIDPRGFDFSKFYSILKSKYSIDIE